MKKKLLFAFIIMIFPFLVQAKEYCTVISGNGKDIGSEIACGPEHFYVVENNSNKLKMLSKYNLYVGIIYDKILLNINDSYVKEKCYDSSCSSYSRDSYYYFDGVQLASESDWESSIKEKYNLDELYILDLLYSNYVESNGAFYYPVYGDIYMEGNDYYQNYTLKLYPYNAITNNTRGYAIQNELALGVTGEKGNANYPIYGTFPILYDFFGSEWLDVHVLNNFEDGYTNFEFTSGATRTHLNDYYNNLVDMGFDVSEVEMISLEEINNLVYSVTNENLPLSDWYVNSSFSEPIIEDENESFILGDLKHFLSAEYSWLWNTSYWTSTATGNYNDYIDSDSYVYFVSSSGDICYSTGDCFSGIPRSGLRPVVTINKSNIKYRIDTKSSDSSVIEFNDVLGGESIKFKVNSKNGDKLIGLIISMGDGLSVEIHESDFSVDDSGLYTINSSVFTMPFESITIEPKWEYGFFNPKTGVGFYMIILVLMICFSTFLHIYFKRKKIYKEIN